MEDRVNHSVVNQGKGVGGKEDPDGPHAAVDPLVGGVWALYAVLVGV